MRSLMWIEVLRIHTIVVAREPVHNEVSGTKEETWG